MANFFHLFLGEVKRLFKYKIIFFGIVVSLIWVGIIFALDKDTAKGFLPFLAMLDAGMMSIVLLAASFYLEKSEGSLATLFVSPVSMAQVLLSKLSSAIFSAFISMMLVLGAGYFIHQIPFSIPLAILYLIAIVSSHTAIGYWITLKSKDFPSMMMRFMFWVLLMMIPSFLAMLKILTGDWKVVFLISPMYAAETLITSLTNGGEALPVILGCVYLLAIASLLYIKVVYPRFKRHAIGG